jgi:hypothetical protein
MFINKIGHEHVTYRINNQDYGFIKDNVKCIVDGCSEGLHSDVGAKLFCELFQNESDINNIFNKIINLIGNTPTIIKNYLCFTILYIKEDRNNFYVYYCGDGYIIKQKHNKDIEFERIDNGEYPKYFAYNFLPEDKLLYYKNGVNFSYIIFSKLEYKNIGLATDGLRYIFNTEHEDKFIELLRKNKETSVKLFINKNHNIFKDDITIIL